MVKILGGLFSLALCFSAQGQRDLQKLSEAEARFESVLSDRGMKPAFLEFLAPDAVIFRPDAVNGLQYWKAADVAGTVLVRRMADADISSNGLLGYTTGDWRLYEEGKSEASAKFGQWVTVWKRTPDGRFAIVLDIGTSHNKLTFAETDRAVLSDKGHDPNKRGWSTADASMNFLRASMSAEGLSGAYERFADDHVRLLVEKEPPIIGKKRVVSVMKDYRSINFPRTVTSFQSADLAYTWNPCQFDNTDEGVEKGNCLHVWKLRDKKWWIVLGVFARVPHQTVPTLRTRRKNRKTSVQ